MTENLNSKVSEVPRGYRNICEYAFIGCDSSKEIQNFETICSVNRGGNCDYKTFRVSNLSDGMGVL